MTYSIIALPPFERELKIYLLAIYDKSEKENISENELDRLLKIIAETI